MRGGSSARSGLGGAELALAALVVGVVAMLIVPLPTWLLDILLATNLSLSVAILLVVLYVPDALAIATFPTLLLLTTLFRLALNVSTSRLILLQANAGDVIKAFGGFVVRGNYVVGAVVFLVLTIIQFIVIAKGSERVAEVGARFVLDAMPGKQMAIDADLRSGDIEKKEARRRRFVLDKESQFFGAMDGAMRFVKGDAIAALVVVFVNLFGGLLIGVMQKGMRFGEAIHVYSILSIGDGLVAQIPSMFIAISAGIVVTRVATDKSSDLGRDIGRQLASEPRSLLIAGGIIGLFSFVPGFPTVIFLIVAGLIGGAGLYLARGRSAVAKADSDKIAAADSATLEATTVAEKTLPRNMPGEVFTVITSEAIIEDLEARGIAKRYGEELARLSRKLGFDMPPVGFIADEDADGFRFFLEGIPTEFLSAEDCGDDELVLAFLRRNVEKDAARAFDVDAAAAWLASQRERHPKLVADVEQAVTPLLVVDFGRELLEDGLPLTQSRIILETMMRAQKYGGKVSDMVDVARLLMKRAITARFTDADGQVNLVICSPDAENVLRRASEQNAGARAAPALGEEVRRLLQQIRQVEDRMAAEGRPVALALPADMRRYTRTLLGIQTSHMPIVAFSELEPGSRLRTILVLTAQLQGMGNSPEALDGVPAPAPGAPPKARSQAPASLN